MKKFTALLFSLCFISTLSFGQYYYLKNATPGQNPGNLNQDDTEYPNGSGLAAGWTSILGPSVASPTWSAVQTIPFTFNFNGSPVTQYKVSSTGVLTFTTGAATAPSAANGALPSASIPDASVCVWGIECSGGNDEVVTKTFGTAGGRQHWVFFTSHSLNGGWSYWSIVLEEGSDKIYVVDQRHSLTSGGVSMGVQINSSTATVVTGTPSVLPEAGTDATAADNVYYEFIYGTQAPADAEMTSLSVLPYAAAGPLNITGTVTNLGANPITAMDIIYDAGAGPQTDVLTGLNIPSSGTYNFSHATPLTIVAGNNYNITVTVNQTGDAVAGNNSLSTSTTGLNSVPAKTVVGEEKTGTWCGWCPRGAVGLAGMEATSSFIGIAVHNSDPMTISAYDGNIGTYIPGGYPGGGVDRVIDGDPSQFSSMHSQRVGDVVPCAVNSINAVYNSSTNMISVSTVAEFFGTISGNYRLSCVIVEDDLQSTASGWAQTNYYSGGGNGSMAFPAGINSGYDFGAAAAPDPVPASAFGGYDHTARSLSNNDILGNSGSLPAGSVPMGTHNYSFSAIPTSSLSGFADAGFDWTKAHAVVMIVNASNGEILNALEVSLSMVTGTEELTDNNVNLEVYPNPTKEVANVTFSLEDTKTVKMEVFNAMGSLVYTENAGLMNKGNHILTFNGTELNSGFYFINLTVGNDVITKKISLLK